MRYLFLSPHLDDVVFSAGALIATLTASGHEVFVATFFTKGPGLLYQRRKQDDHHALTLLDAQGIHLDLEDAPFRFDGYSCFHSILFHHNIPARELPLVQTMESRIKTLREQLLPQHLFAPLGVGGHIDHHLLFAASRPFPCTYYEDAPYSYVPTWSHTRWHSLGAIPNEPRPFSTPSLLDVDEPFIAHYGASQKAFDLFAAESASACLSDEWDGYRALSHPHVTKKEEAMRCYATEYPFLFKNLKQETYWRLHAI